MAPISKEHEVITAAPETAGAVSGSSGARLDETASKPQPVALEVPVTVNGARTVEGSDKREPFSEATKTVLVFGNGAVIRLGSPVAAGQLLFLTNEKTKKEVVCQVVKSKNYRNVSGYVELEFTESVVGFWGMRFPSDRIGAQTPVHSATIPPPVRSAAPPPAPAAPKLATPAISAAPRVPEVSPAQVHAEIRPAVQERPAEIRTAAPTAVYVPASVPSNTTTAPPQTTAAPVPPITKSPAMPESPVPSMPSSLESSLASLLSTPEVQGGLTATKPPASVAPSENKAAPANVAADNSSEELKLQASRLQEQLSSLLFSAAPTAKPAAPALDSKGVSGVVAKVLEIAKADAVPVKAAPSARTIPPSPPMKSLLDSEEVKIPSWLEPLARNAAASSPTPEPSEREKSKHAAEIASHEELSAEPLAAVTMESASESHLPTFGSLLPLDEAAAAREHSSGGSRKGLWIGAIAAVALLAAGGAWYEFYPSNALRGASAHAAAPAPSIQTSAALPANGEARGGEHASSRNDGVEPEAAPGVSATPRANAGASSESLPKPQAGGQPVPVTRDNTRGDAVAIPAAVTERISRPAPAPEPKKPALGEVHLANPTMNRTATAQNDAAAAPTLAAGADVPNVGGIDSSIASERGRQPAVPEVPLPIGGDVQTAKLIAKVDPVYPMIAKNQHVSGNVVIDALIDANGRVTTMKVISGPTLLQQAAEDALHQWKYQPASLDGKAVAMHLTVTLQFRMK
ncbi:MAG: energy transducer TonB [Candidatus Acidiferrum sp.]